MLDGLDVAEDLAFALRDGQQLAGFHQRVDLLERLGQPGQAVRFVEHELADELFQPADALEGFRLAEQLLGGVGGADADRGVQLGQILRLHLGGEPPAALLEHAGVESPCGPTVADVLDVEVAVTEHEPARRVVARLPGQPLQDQPRHRAPGVAGVGDRDRRPGGAVAAQVHHPAAATVAALAPRPAHVLVDGAPASARPGSGVVAGSVEVAPVERQETQRDGIQQRGFTAARGAGDERAAAAEGDRVVPVEHPPVDDLQPRQMELFSHRVRPLRCRRPVRHHGRAVRTAAAAR